MVTSSTFVRLAAGWSSLSLGTGLLDCAFDGVAAEADGVSRTQQSKGHARSIDKTTKCPTNNKLVLIEIIEFREIFVLVLLRRCASETQKEID